MEWRSILTYGKYKFTGDRYKINEFGKIYDNHKGTYITTQRTYNDKDVYYVSLTTENGSQITVSTITLLYRLFVNGTSKCLRIKDKNIPLHYSNIEEKSIDYTHNKTVVNIILENRHNHSLLKLKRKIKKETGIDIQPYILSKHVKKLFVEDPFKSVKKLKYVDNCKLKLKIIELVEEKLSKNLLIDKKSMKKYFKDHAKPYIVDKLLTEVFNEYSIQIDTNNCLLLYNKNGKNAVYENEELDNIIVLKDGIYKRDTQKYYELNKHNPVYVFGSEGYITFNQLYKNTFGEKLN